MSKILYYVHCHLCPLKDLCEFEASDESYKFQHRYPIEPIEIQRLEIATNNCPLKKLLKV